MISVVMRAFHSEFLWGWGEPEDGAGDVIVVGGVIPCGILMAPVDLAGVTVVGQILHRPGDGRQHLGPVLLVGEEVSYQERASSSGKRQKKCDQREHRRRRAPSGQPRSTCAAP